MDLTGTLFGDVLAVGTDDILMLSGVGIVVLTAAALFHRAFMAAAFNHQKAATLGFRPRLTHFVLLCLITLTVAASFQVVGTLLVFGLLIAPPAAALVWAKSIRTVMVLGALIGVASVITGLGSRGMRPPPPAQPSPSLLPSPTSSPPWRAPWSAARRSRRLRPP